MDSKLSAESTKRSERRYSVSDQYIGKILDHLRNNGTIIRHSAEDVSKIVSIYYECDKIKADNNASIRQRTYLTDGIEDVFRLPCIVDAKVEVSAVSQVKWRRAFETWQEAQRQLCAPPSFRQDDFFPELVRHYGGIGTLSAEYGVKYDRLYFSMPGGLGVTIDSNITILSIRSTGQLALISELTDGILELKGLASTSQVPEQVHFAEFLQSMGLPPSTPKRAKARTLISEFKNASQEMPVRSFN